MISKEVLKKELESIIKDAEWEIQYENESLAHRYDDIMKAEERILVAKELFYKFCK